MSTQRLPVRTLGVRGRKTDWDHSRGGGISCNFAPFSYKNQNGADRRELLQRRPRGSDPSSVFLLPLGCARGGAGRLERTTEKLNFRRFDFRLAFIFVEEDALLFVQQLSVGNLEGKTSNPHRAAGAPLLDTLV